MEAEHFLTAGIVLSIILIIWLTTIIVSYYKRHQANKELWATIFEGMTNKLIDLTPIKLPDTYIEKKAQKDGLNEKPDLQKNTLNQFK